MTKISPAGLISIDRKSFIGLRISEDFSGTSIKSRTFRRCFRLVDIVEIFYD